jgi:TonB-linked SusC/RagA family outer membrane protein
MQDFAASKVSAMGGALNQLTCLLKSRAAARVMKLTGIILLAGCLQLSARGLTQTVTISVKDAPLLTVLKAIEKQTGYVFFVDNQWLQKAKKVTITANNVPLQKVLDDCFKDQPLTYSITGKVINVTPRDRINSENFGSLTVAIEVTGRVTDTDGNPLEGATVKVKGTTIITSTNASGSFVLKNVDENSVLEISFVGYENLNVLVNNRKSIAVSLKVDIPSLNEVVINKGYYTETRRFSTSNVSKITSKDIEKQPVQNPLLTLQGRVPGVTIVQNTGVAGGGVTIRIQGINSIGGILDNSTGNDPLFVIDGVPYVSGMLITTIGGGTSPILQRSGNGNAGNPLNYINPADIESIEILKDADATAIYGSRAANGAILITTKRGKAGPMHVDINIQQGIGKVNHFLDLLNTEQYLMMRKEAYKNDNVAIPSILTSPSDGNYDVNGLWDTSKYTNWQKIFIGGTAQYSDARLSVYGGSNTTQYRIGATYNRSTTVFPGDFADYRAGIHFNINSTSINQRFQLQLSGSFLHDNNELPANDFISQVFLAPNAPDLYNPDGTLNWEPTPTGKSSWSNPLANKFLTYDNVTTNLISNARLNYKILGGLELKTNIGYTSLKTDEIVAAPKSVYSPENRANIDAQATYTNSTINSWVIEPQLNYSGSIKKIKVDALIGSSIQQRDSKGDVLLGSGYDNDQVLKDKRAATTLRATNTEYSVYKYFGVYGRLNFVLGDKYIMNLTGRRDGSSRFGPQSRFHNFGSIGLGWVFSDEAFINKNLPFLNFGKLRASYGTTGNDQIGDYTFMNLYNTQIIGIPFQGLVGRFPVSLYNPYLEWEETKKLQGGIDLSIWKSRIQLTINYVYNRSSNQLLGYALPQITGFQQITANFPATVQNKAWEFSLNTRNVSQGGFRWNTAINLTFPKNKLVSFPDLEKSTYASKLIIGQPIGVFSTYHFLGVNPLTGRYQLADHSGNPTFSPSAITDKNVLISVDPKYYGGIQNTIEFKGIQLDFLFQFVRQLGGVFVLRTTPGRFSSGLNNQPKNVLSRWQKPGDVSAIERFTQNTVGGTRGEASFADASYIKLRNVSLSWQLPSAWKNKLHMQNGRLYVQGENLWTITNYEGFDPENQNLSALPPLRMITTGVQLTF